METMTTDMDLTLQILDIIEFLIAQERELWESVKNADLVFGSDSEATIRAKARWSTANQILKQVLTITNNN